MSERDWRASDDRRADAVALDSLPKRAYWLIALVALGMLGAWVVMEVQASVTGFVNAEGLWSKMQKQSVLALYRYAENGDPRLMAEARAALKTPLEDLAFRDAMERPSPDFAAARTHLRAAGNREEDVERILWAYRFFADAPYLRDSIRAWKRTDADLQALVDMADEMEARVRAGPLDPAAAADYRRRLVEINARMYPLTVAFSDSLARGANAIRNLLLVLSSIVFVLLTWYALWVMRRTLRHVRETESEFRLAFHQSAVGMLKINPDGSFAQANEAMAKLLACPCRICAGCACRTSCWPRILPRARTARSTGRACSVPASAACWLAMARCAGCAGPLRGWAVRGARASGRSSWWRTCPTRMHLRRKSPTRPATTN